MRTQSMRWVFSAAVGAAAVAACGITLDVGPSAGDDGGTSSSSSSSSSASSSSSSGAPSGSSSSSSSSSGDAATTSSSSSGSTSSSSSGAALDSCSLLDFDVVCNGKCGAVDDGCNGQYECGGCGSNLLLQCDNNVCVCHPVNVCEFACGPGVPTGCGNDTVDCPSACPAGKVCGAEFAHVCGCKDANPTATCNTKPDGTHKACGVIKNNCGRDVDCTENCAQDTCQACTGGGKCCR